MKLAIIFLCLCLILQGCGANHCITVGGKYEGVDGNLTYCYSPEKSAAEGKPVLQSSTGDAYLLPASDVAIVSEMLTTSSSGPNALATQGTPCQQITERIKAYRARSNTANVK